MSTKVFGITEEDIKELYSDWRGNNIDLWDIPVDILNRIYSDGCRDVISLISKKLYKSDEEDKWHYPSRGEFPEEVKLVLLKVPGCYMLGWYRDKTWFFDKNYFDDDENEMKCNVFAWQYIEPPKEV